MEPYTTETIDRLFLELSQFTSAKTAREIQLESQLARLTAVLEEIVCTEGEDAGVVMLSYEGTTHFDPEVNANVYDHEFFSPLGDALMKAWKITQED